MDNRPLEQLTYIQSNILISSKFKSNLIDNQILAIALTRIENNVVNDKISLSATIYKEELKQLLKCDDVHLARDLHASAGRLQDRRLIINGDDGSFVSMVMTPTVAYIAKTGEFKINFNEQMLKHIFQIKDGFTIFQLSLMTNFENNATFRLYELFKKEAYQIPKFPNGYKEIIYNLSEFRVLAGTVDINDDEVQKEIKKPNLDWDVFFNNLDKDKKTYSSWGDFQRRFLQPAQQEMEQKADIRFEYFKEPRGKTIRFKIYRNKPIENDKVKAKQQIIESNAIEINEEEITFINKYCGHNNLTDKDLKNLLIKADGNVEKIEKAIEMADSQKEIRNYMGWLISCLENDYNNVETLSGSSEKAEKINEIKDDYEKNKKNIAAIVWGKTKGKDDFKDFINYLEDNSMDLEMLEQIFEPDILAHAYADWKMGRPVNFN